MITGKVRLGLINLFIVFFYSLLLELYDQEFENNKFLVTSLYKYKLFRKIIVILHKASAHN